MLSRHLLGYLPVNLAQLIVGFGGVWALTRLLETGEYGLYAAVMAAMSFLHVPLFTWIEAAAARFYARAEARGETASHFRTLVAIYALMAGPAVLLLTVIAIFAPMPDGMRAAFAFMAGSILFRSLVKLILESHRAEHRVKRYGLTESLNLIVGFGLGLALIWFTPLRAAGPFAGLLVAAIIVLALEAPSLWRRCAGGQVEWPRARAYAAYGLPISLSLILHHIVAGSDRFLVLALLGDSAAGVYAAGYALADRTIDIIFVWIGLAATPIAITALERGGAARAKQAARNNIQMMALIGVPAALGLALVAEPLAAVMTGEAFRDQAAIIIPWIALAALLNGVTVYYLHEAFILSGKTRMIPVVMVGPAVLNVALNIILLPLIGLMGAVAATLAAYALGAALSLFVGRRYFALPLPWMAFARIGVAAAIMGVIVWLTPATPWAIATLALKGFVGVAVYAGMAWALNAGECRAIARELLPSAFRLKEAPA